VNPALSQARAHLLEGLHLRQPEIEAAVMTRVYAVNEPASDADPAYLQGLRAAVSAAVVLALVALEEGEDRILPIPDALLNQARLAARHQVTLDTVLRRYCAGQSLLADFLVEEAERVGLSSGALQSLLRTQAALFDHLLEAIGAEHSRAAPKLPASGAERRAKRIDRLLAGEMVDASELGYDVTGHHLGLVVRGPEPDVTIRALADSLDRRLLITHGEEDTVLAWLGGRRPLDSADLEGLAATPLPGGGHMALGEPGEGIAGWRLTHLQARAAFSIAVRRPEPVVRYSQVALLASLLTDELLATSLRQIYLRPLEDERDSGKAARETLRAYFAAGRNVASAAALLGLSRQAVAKRIRAIEERIGRSLLTDGPELEIALDLEALHLPEHSRESLVAR
jgi:PucR C-terminal helix-turn-helix domain/GGDEF-like domain